MYHHAGVRPQFASTAPAPCRPRKEQGTSPSCPELAHFIPLGDSELSKLKAIAQPDSVGANQRLFLHGEAADSAFLLSTGAVRTFRLLPDGRRLITAFMFEGDFLGFAVDGRYEFAAETITPVRLCRFPRHRLEALLDDCPRLRNTLLHFATEELRLAQDHMVLLGRKSATEKLASFLLHLARRNARGGAATTPAVVPLPMTRSDIADYLGLTTETVSRALARLRTRGTIALPTLRNVAVLRPRDLDALAGGADLG